MRLKINKACDINSISVFPTHSRRLSSIPNGSQNSQLRPTPMSQQSFSQGNPQIGNPSLASQLRSQPSQQPSMSQGVSSQCGVYSQLSQNPLDDTLTTDLNFSQRCQSQDPVANSGKKLQSLPGARYTCEDNRLAISRPSSNAIRERNDDLDRRLGAIETFLNKFNIILNSVQTDVIQINRGSKETTVEMDAMRQRLATIDTSLQQVMKIQEDSKCSFNESIKELFEQQKKNENQEKLERMCTALSTLPRQIQTFLHNMQAELRIKAGNLSKQDHGCTAAPQRRESNPNKKQVNDGETKGWRSVKALHASSNDSPVQKQKNLKRIVIDSDEDLDGGFSFLIDEKDTGIQRDVMEEAIKDTERILRRARRRKRRICNPIVIL